MDEIDDSANCMGIVGISIVRFICFIAECFQDVQSRMHSGKDRSAGGSIVNGGYQLMTNLQYESIET